VYKIIPHKRVIKFINSRNSKDKQRIKEKFQQLQQNPYPSNIEIDSKKMQNKDGFRLRIGGYRFIYDIVDEELIVYIEKGDNRGDIY
jgi:mRNA interferase RelE/StbE